MRKIYLFSLIQHLLKRRRWEGNVRELKNVVTGLAIKIKDGWIGREELKEIPLLAGLRSICRDAGTTVHDMTFHTAS